MKASRYFDMLGTTHPTIRHHVPVKLESSTIQHLQRMNCHLLVPQNEDKRTWEPVREEKRLKLISSDKKQTEVRFIKRLCKKKGGSHVERVVFANVFHLWDYQSDFEKTVVNFCSRLKIAVSFNLCSYRLSLIINLCDANHNSYNLVYNNNDIIWRSKVHKFWSFNHVNTLIILTHFPSSKQLLPSSACSETRSYKRMYFPYIYNITISTRLIK
jgi:hypothetical protein